MTHGHSVLVFNELEGTPKEKVEKYLNSSIFPELVTRLERVDESVFETLVRHFIEERPQKINIIDSEGNFDDNSLTYTFLKIYFT
jgi:hypothetical protein